jgi:hypothetical protein
VLELPAAGLAVKLGRNKRRASVPRREREDRSIRGRRADSHAPGGIVYGQTRTGLGVFDGRGRQDLPGRGGDGEAVETGQVGVGDQPGLPVALLELDRWKSPRLAVG